MRSFRKTGRIKVFFRDPNKKGLFKILKEVLGLWRLKKEFPFYYFKYIYRKNVTNYKDYLSTKEVTKIGLSKKLHNPIYHKMIEDKLEFALLDKKNSFKTPKLTSYNIGQDFYFNDSIFNCSNEDELINFFNQVFNTTELDALFFRPTSDYGGKGCFKLSKNNLEDQIQDKIGDLFSGSFVHNEVVKQHEALDEIHPNSVNTIRLLSYITEKGDIEIVGSFIRFGVGDSVVDNASSGGIFVGVNIEDGTLKKKGHYFIEHGGAEILKHPRSGFVFKGFKIPFYEEAKEEVRSALKIIPDRFIGWDVAITPNGPVIIETNAGPHLPGSDVAHGGFLKDKIWRDLLKELDEN